MVVAAMVVSLGWMPGVPGRDFDRNERAGDFEDRPRGDGELTPRYWITSSIMNECQEFWRSNVGESDMLGL